jgi:hypothetical protein
LRSPAGVARERIGSYDHVLRQLEVGDPLGEVGQHGRHVDAAPRRGHEDGADLLTQHLVGYADDGRLEDGRRAVVSTSMRSASIARRNSPTSNCGMITVVPCRYTASSS